MGAPQYGLDNYIGAFNFKVEIDNIEVSVKKAFPFVKHVDLEIL